MGFGNLSNERNKHCLQGKLPASKKIISPNYIFSKVYCGVDFAKETTAFNYVSSSINYLDVFLDYRCWQRKALTRFQTRWIIRMVLYSALFTQPHHLAWRIFRRAVSHCCSWSVPQLISFFLFRLLSLYAHCSTKNFLVEPHSFVRVISYLLPRDTRVGIRLGSLCWLILQTFEHSMFSLILGLNS